MGYSFLTPLQSYPFLVTLIISAAGGITYAAINVVRAIRSQKPLHTAIVFLLLLTVANGILFAKSALIAPRHLRELYTLSAPFIGIFFVQLIRRIPHAIGVFIISLLLVIGLSEEFSSMGRYEKANPLDWSYLAFFDWAEKNMPPDAYTLTDPFTFHAMMAALPYIRSADSQKDSKTILAPGVDPRTIIFEGNPQQMRIALTVLCPDYIIIDSVVTQQFYPLTLLQYDQKSLSGLLVPIYRQQTARSYFMVFQTVPGVCSREAGH